MIATSALFPPPGPSDCSLIGTVHAVATASVIHALLESLTLIRSTVPAHQTPSAPAQTSTGQ